MFSTQEEEAETARKEKAGLAVNYRMCSLTIECVLYPGGGGGDSTQGEGRAGSEICQGKKHICRCRRPCPARGAAG